MKTPSVFIIGDSISIQYDPYLQEYLKGKFSYLRKKGLAESLKNLDIPEGANGGDSSMVLDYISNNKYHREIPYSDYLLINCGLHDIKTNLESGKKQIEINIYEKNLQAIVNISKTMCKKFIWISTTPCDEKVHNKPHMGFNRFHKDSINYKNVAERVMKKNKIQIIDLYTLTLNLGDNLYCDHVHFNEHVRQKQAAFIAEWLY